MANKKRPKTNEPEVSEPVEQVILDPIGDVTDSEAETPDTDSPEPEEGDANPPEEEEKESGEDETESADDAEDKSEDESESDSEDEAESEPKAKRPPAKLERLQKLLAAAGVASRRKAEEMIEQGRVQVNGKVVTELGTKADLGRDHIRVDGKLLQGAERLRYFVLNKPRGFVTTVKDPEGRPTVMQFFDKMRERLYPVGRLDYMSEGLLLVTNDGELANKLTKASAGVEKTYLVKVAGVPTEGELDILRAGVAIEKGKPGSAKVRTSPARIRQVRQGDNPWYEVVLIEGRNRELRKMFEEVGHFVEKIRRVGYGPLILDQEPGNLRELDAQELELLRKAADGKWKTPKAKEIRRRNIVDSLPPEKPAFRARGERPAAGPKDYKPKKSFGTERPARTGPPAKFGGRPAEGDAPRPAWKRDATAAGKPAGRPPARFAPGQTGGDRPAASGKSYGDRPAVGRSFGAKPAARTYGAKPGTGRPAAGKPFGDKPFGDKTGAGRPFGDRPSAGRSFPAKPAWQKSDRPERAPYKRPAPPKPEFTRKPAPEPEDLEPRKSFKIHIEPVQDFDRTERARPSRPTSSRPPSGGRPPAGYSGTGRTGADRAETGRSSTSRPFRSEGGMARPFTTSSGKPRAGGARPSSKPGRDAGRPSGPRSSGAGAGRGGPRAGGDSRPSFGAKRPFGAGGSGRPSGGAARRPFPPREGGGASESRPPRPFTPRGEGGGTSRPRSESSAPERRTGAGWKPKPNFGGKSKPAGGQRSGPKTGGSSRPGGKSSGYKGKPGGSGPSRSGPRPGGKRPGGKRP